MGQVEKSGGVAWLRPRRQSTGTKVDSARLRLIGSIPPPVGCRWPRRPVAGHPTSFLQTLVHDLAVTPGLTVADAGFEQGKWRAEQLAEHMFEWIPEFALGYAEYASMNGTDAVAKIKSAMRNVYDTDKFKRRGE